MVTFGSPLLLLGSPSPSIDKITGAVHCQKWVGFVVHDRLVSWAGGRGEGKLFGRCQVPFAEFDRVEA